VSTVPLEIYKERRVVMVRWVRGKSGDPDAQFPEVDARGTRALDAYGPIVGMMAGKTATVGLLRELIDPAADLYVDVHSGGECVSIVNPADGHLPATATMSVGLSCLSGDDDPSDATIEVRFGSLTGPVISTLLVRCYPPRNINITPHIVTINDATGTGGTPSVAVVADVMAQAQAIWRPCGIFFNVSPTLNDPVSLATANVLAETRAELTTLLGTRNIPGTINAYFVPQIGAGSFSGLGFSRPTSVKLGVGNPGIILADQVIDSGTTIVRDATWGGATIAHESGHFLGLPHPNSLNPPNEREDTWSRLDLMHNFYRLMIQGNWKDDLGYGAPIAGNGRRGALITNKDLPHIVPDSQCSKARQAIHDGPY
jgi:hypothetical protein